MNLHNHQTFIIFQSQHLLKFSLTQLYIIFETCYNFEFFSYFIGFHTLYYLVPLYVLAIIMTIVSYFTSI